MARRSRFLGVLAGPIFVFILSKRLYRFCSQDPFWHPGVFWGQFWVPFWFSFCTLFRMPNFDFFWRVVFSVHFTWAFVLILLPKPVLATWTLLGALRWGPLVREIWLFAAVSYWLSRFGRLAGLRNSHSRCGSQAFSVIRAFGWSSKFPFRWGLSPVWFRIAFPLGFKPGLV